MEARCEQLWNTLPQGGRESIARRGLFRPSIDAILKLGRRKTRFRCLSRVRSGKSPYSTFDAATGLRIGCIGNSTRKLSSFWWAAESRSSWHRVASQSSIHERTSPAQIFGRSEASRKEQKSQSRQLECHGVQLAAHSSLSAKKRSSSSGRASLPSVCLRNPSGGVARRSTG
jgi:hypothetical protein